MPVSPTPPTLNTRLDPIAHFPSVRTTSPHSRTQHALASSSAMDAPPPPPPSPAAAEVLSSPDLLCLITARVGAGDLLCWALGCRAFRAAQIEARPGPGGRITTPIEAFVGSSEERCAWARGLGAAPGASAGGSGGVLRGCGGAGVPRWGPGVHPGAEG